MSFPKLFVTYCVMDPDAGANVLGHACLILSVQNEANKPIEVIDSVGFYSQPSTTTNQFLRLIKYILNIKVDLQEGHGFLKQEVMHELDGNGLFGKTFEVTQTQFDALRNEYQEQIRMENSAISELDISLPAEGKASNGHTRYLAEQELAIKESRAPRLLPFQLEMNFGWYGLDSSKSHTCKTRVLDLLQKTKIITAEVREQLNGGAALRAFPRPSGEALSPIRLVSTGNLHRVESKKSGLVFYNRKVQKNSLFFASPLRLHVSSTRQAQTAAVENKAIQSVRDILTQARYVENKIQHAIHKTQNSNRKTTLLRHATNIQKLYEEFCNSSENSLYNEQLSEKLVQAKFTLNVAEMAIDPTRINCPFIFRVYESIFVRHALLALIGLALTASLIGTVTGTMLFVASTCYLLHNLYGFYQEETQFLEKSSNYIEYIGSRKRSRASQEEDIVGGQNLAGAPFG